MAEVRKFGVPLPGWQVPLRPEGEVLDGIWVRLERMDPDAHAADLFRAWSGHDGLWDYMPYGPFSSAAAYHRWAKDAGTGSDPLFYVIRQRDSGHCGGVAAYLRIAPDAGSIEVGHINLSPELNRSRAATEAMYLMMDWAFRAGYRRYEWKCDALNMASRRAAQRAQHVLSGQTVSEFGAAVVHVRRPARACQTRVPSQPAPGTVSALPRRAAPSS